MRPMISPYVYPFLTKNIRIVLNADTQPLEVLKSTAKYFEEDLKDILKKRGYKDTFDLIISECRKRDVVDVRFFFMRLMSEECKWLTLTDIGKTLGGRDHSTIINGKQALQNAIDYEEILGNTNALDKYNDYKEAMMQIYGSDLKTLNEQNSSIQNEEATNETY